MDKKLLIVIAAVMASSVFARAGNVVEWGIAPNDYGEFLVLTKRFSQIPEDPSDTFFHVYLEDGVPINGSKAGELIKKMRNEPVSFSRLTAVHTLHMQQYPALSIADIWRPGPAKKFRGEAMVIMLEDAGVLEVRRMHHNSSQFKMLNHGLPAQARMARRIVPALFKRVLQSLLNVSRNGAL